MAVANNEATKMKESITASTGSQKKMLTTVSLVASPGIPVIEKAAMTSVRNRECLEQRPSLEVQAAITPTLNEILTSASLIGAVA